MYPEHCSFYPTGNSYKFQAGNRVNAMLWFKHLSAACQSNRQQVRGWGWGCTPLYVFNHRPGTYEIALSFIEQVPANLMTFEWSSQCFTRDQVSCYCASDIGGKVNDEPGHLRRFPCLSMGSSTLKQWTKLIQFLALTVKRERGELYSLHHVR